MQYMNILPLHPGSLHVICLSEQAEKCPTLFKRIFFWGIGAEAFPVFFFFLYSTSTEPKDGRFATFHERKSNLSFKLTQSHLISFGNF